MELGIIRTYLVLLCLNIICEIKGVSIHKNNVSLDDSNTYIRNSDANIDSQNDLNIKVNQLIQEVKTLQDEMKLLKTQCTLHHSGENKEHHNQKRGT